MRHTRPRTAVEGLTCRRDRPRHVLLFRFGNTEEEILGARIDDVNQGVRSRCHPFPANEESVGMAQECCAVARHHHVELLVVGAIPCLLARLATGTIIYLNYLDG